MNIALPVLFFGKERNNRTFFSQSTKDESFLVQKEPKTVLSFGERTKGAT